MNTQSFTHNGVEYILTPLTVFKSHLMPFIFLQSGDSILKSIGFQDGTNTPRENIPPFDEVLISRFVNWMSVTNIEGDVPYALNIFTANSDEIILKYGLWREAIFTDDDLADKWFNAHQALYELDTDKKKPGKSGETK